MGWPALFCNLKQAVMADNMIFPIGFDLETGVKQAAKDWDGKYAAMLEKEIQKRALKVRLSFDTKNLDNIDAVKQRLAQLKIEPVSSENKAAIKELVKELKELAKAMEKVSKFKGIELPELQAAKAAKMRKDVEQADEKLRLSQERVRISQERLTMAQQKSEQQAQRTGKAYNTQRSFLEGLLKRMATYWSIRQVGNFLANIREVTAQFELQRVSLGAIIQDQTRANRLFSEIKTFALKSPVTILDLTKYTKQVAAYGIETDKLFDTTKRLADVSVGLGVDMGRITLAYGQVKAASYLRAAEIRQFTEAGIPMLELLAKKFTALNGEMVTTEQVMDMVSKRGVDFKMVEEIFNDMTSAGGMFYNMQEKQGNTLYGMWSKLGDAASMMYDEIGNTDAVAGGMRIMIQFATDLMKNWKAVRDTMVAASAAFAVFGVYAKAINIGTAISMAKVKAATAERVQAQVKLNAALKEGTAAEIANARAALQTAKANEQAAISAQKSLTASQKLKSGLMSIGTSLLKGLGVGLAITAVTMIVYKLAEAWENAHKLENALAEIQKEGAVEAASSVSNFNRLAKAVVEAADGSKKQADALEEMKRTYGDMIPVQDLTVEKLKAMNGNYTELTNNIREYIAMKTKEREATEIAEEYGDDIAEAEKSAQKRLKGKTVGGYTFDDASINYLIQRMKELGEKGGMSFKDAFNKVMTNELGGRALANPKMFYEDLYEVFYESRKMSEDLEMLEQRYTKVSGAVGIFAKMQGELNERMKSYIELNNLNSGNFIDKQRIENERNLETIRLLSEAVPELKGRVGEFAQLVTDFNEKRPLDVTVIDFERLKEVLSSIPNAAAGLGGIGSGISSISDSLKGAGISLESLGEKLRNADSGSNIKTAGYNVDAFRRALLNVNPALGMFLDGLKQGQAEALSTEPTVRKLQERAYELADAYGLSSERVQTFMMKNGESLEDYAKRLRDLLPSIKSSLQNFADAHDFAGKGVIALEYQDEYKEKQKKAEEDVINKLLKELPSKESNRSSKSDTRLQTLNEMESTLTSINKKYEELVKKEGQAAALDYVKKNYASTLKYVNQLGKKFKLNFEMPTEFSDLQSYRAKILNVIKKLRMKGYEKAAVELELKIAEESQGELEKKLEAKLKALADRISRTKTAREFYDKVLGMTGDYDLAAKVSLSIYGDTGYDLQKQLAEQVRSYFQNDQVSIEIPVDVITADNQINYKRLGEFAEQMKKQLGDEPYKVIKKIAEEGQKDLAKTYEGYLKDLEKAKTYADKRVELARTTAAKIREIERNPQLSKEQKAELKRGYQEREDKEAAKLEYEAFKDTPLYVQMFEDLEHASTSTLEMMKSRLEALSGVWGTALDPTQLKEIQSRMNEIDGQLRERNPFKTLKESYRQYRDAVKSVSLQGAEENAAAASKDLYDKNEMYGADSAQALAAEKELKAREKIVEIARQITAENKKGQDALDAAAQKANDNLQIKRGELEIASAEEQALRDKSTYEDPNQDPAVIAAHEKVEAAREEVNLAERVAEITTNNAKTAKTLKENFASAAGQVVQSMQIGGDLAHAVADTMEALGGDEDDVQFWNDIGTAIDDLTAGFQGIIDSIMSLNVAGVISNAIGAIPNMVKGFVGLFSAGKVRKANKEIKKQQELIDQLEESYSRLQSAADKLFGKDYISNFNTQMANLQAQQEAYLKQAEAERSKGKKADEDKIKEYEKSARETAQEIADLQAELVEHFTGTSRADAARQFVESWLEAKTSFASTKDAILSDYKDMIKNMIIEGAAAKIMDTLLAPMWEQMEKQIGEGDIEGAIDYILNGMDEFAERADNSLKVLYKSLEAKGYDMQDILSSGSDESTGIARSVASATSEEINNVATIGNTLMYYVSPIPVISENVAAMRAYLMEGNADAAQGRAGYADLIALQNQSLENQRAIAQYTSEILAECRKTATHCESVATEMHRVVGAKNGKFAINTTLV